MVARDHLDRDARPLGSRDGLRGFGSRRVHEPPQPGEDAAVLGIGTVRLGGARNHLAVGGGDHTQGIGGEVGLGLVHRRAELLGELDDLAVEQHAVAVAKHAIGRALDVQPASAPLARVEGRHVLERARERDLIDPGGVAARPSREDAALRRGDEHRAVGRVSLDAPSAVLVLLEQRVVRGAPHLEQKLDIGPDHLGLVGVRDDVALGRIAVAGHIEALAARPQSRDRHLVSCERAGLVGTHDGAAAQRLDGRDPPHKRPALGHSLYAECKRYAHRGGQTLRDRRDRRGHGEQQHVDDGLATCHAQDEDDRGRNDRQDPEARGKPRQTPLKRRLLPTGRPHFAGDLAHDRVHAGGGHCGGRPSRHHRRGREDDTRAVGEHGVRRELGELLLDRFGLAGERRLVDAQVRLGEQPRIGRDPVAGLDHQHVAHDYLRGVDHPQLAVAQDSRSGARKPLERVERGLGSVLLPHADDDVGDDDERDDDRVEDVLREQRHDSGARQQIHHRVGDLLHDEPPDRGARLGLEGVGTALKQPTSGLLGREAARSGGGELLGDLLGWQRMPRRGGL